MSALAAFLRQRPHWIVETMMPATPKAKAAKLALDAVEKGLAACASVSAPMASVYRWKGKVGRASEVRVIFKTHPHRGVALVDWIHDRHPYELPYIAAVQAFAYDDDLSHWLDQASQPVKAERPARPKKKGR